jgi:hypothetical protein
VLEEPLAVTRVSFECKVSSREHDMDRLFSQDTITTDEFPNAKDTGFVKPKIYGSGILVPALRTDWGAQTTTVDEIDSSQTTGVKLSQPDNFPSSGTVFIDDEEVSYTGISSGELTGVTRAANGTTATTHKAGADVSQKQAQYDSLLADAELGAVSQVFAEYDNRFVKVESGVTASVVGGNQMLIAADKVRISTVGDDFAVTDTIDVDDTITVDTTYEPSEFQVSRKAGDNAGLIRQIEVDTPNGSSFDSNFDITFPAAPAGTLSEIRLRITLNIEILDNTGMTGMVLYAENTGTGEIVARVFPGGVTWDMSQTFEISKSSWVTNQVLYIKTFGSASTPDAVRFTCVDASQHAKALTVVDPDGGFESKKSSNIPIQFDADTINGTGNQNMTAIAFPAAPSGSLSEIRMTLTMEIQVLNGANLTEMILYAGPSIGTPYEIIARVTPSGATWYVSKTFDIHLTSWQTSWTLYIKRVGTGAVTDSVRFNISEATQSARVDEEVNVITVEKGGTVEKTGAVTASGGIVATRTIDRFHALVDGFPSPAAAYGTPGAVMERPDHVIKHWLVQQFGEALADIDSDAFDAAGALYAAAIAGGYKFAFRIAEFITPSEFRKRLARECRSTCTYQGTTWRLDFVPDAAPAAVKDIDEGNIVGPDADMTFDTRPLRTIINKYQGLYARRYSQVKHDSDWEGVEIVSDAASILLHGTVQVDLTFRFVRSALMAVDVLEHYLLESKAPLRRVRFALPHEHLDLQRGDTIDITQTVNANWDGKYYIERLERLEKGIVGVEAVQWWT